MKKADTKKLLETHEIVQEGYTQEEEELMNEIFEESLKSQTEEIQKLIEERDEYKNKYLYAVADTDNVRKRLTAEKHDMAFNAKKNTVIALLPLIDDFKRAVGANESVDNVEELREAFKIMHNKFVSALEHIGVNKIQVDKGTKFNTDEHEAISICPGDEADKDCVIDCTQDGYKLNDKVIRYAKVVVGS